MDVFGFVFIFIIMKCLNCNCDLVGKYSKKFCGSSCAATYNNKKYPKRCMTKTCKACSNKVVHCHTFCDECHKKGKHLRGVGVIFENRTLKSFKKLKGASKFSQIRGHARKVLLKEGRECKCEICGYTHHCEACHIKPISDFNDSDKIPVINDPKNLMWLCPNHHWELDHNILKLGGGGEI